MLFEIKGPVNIWHDRKAQQLLHRTCQYFSSFLALRDNGWFLQNKYINWDPVETCVSLRNWSVNDLSCAMLYWNRIDFLLTLDVPGDFTRSRRPFLMTSSSQHKSTWSPWMQEEHGRKHFETVGSAVSAGGLASFVAYAYTGQPHHFNGQQFIDPPIFS